MCSDKPYFAFAGRKQLLPGEPRPKNELAAIAREVRSSGVTSVTIDSRCKMTGDGVRHYCRIFKDAGVQVMQLIMPKSSPFTHNIRTCAAPDGDE